MPKTHVVVLTGFGPFGDHKINASWEVAKAVKELGIEDLDTQLEIKEIEVSYKTVVEEIPKLWSELKPSLVIHLGVSRLASQLVIESCAHKSGYGRCDVNGEIPPENKCFHGDCEDMFSELDLKKVAEYVNDANIEVSATISTNAGRYLCEFIYYTSLSINNRHSVFIHVPDIGQPYSVQQMAQGVKLIITSLMNQIKITNEKNCLCENIVQNTVQSN